MTNSSGTLMTLTTSWSSRRDPEDESTEAERPPVTEINGHRVRVSNSPIPPLEISWNPFGATNVSLTHSDAIPSRVPVEVVEMLDLVELVGEDEWLEATSDLPATSAFPTP